MAKYAVKFQIHRYNLEFLLVWLLYESLGIQRKFQMEFHELKFKQYSFPN